MNKYTLLVFPWNPNGTNDMAVIDDRGAIIDSFSEALFGYDTKCTSKCRHEELPCGDPHIIELDQALKHIAVSPVSDGMAAIKWIASYMAPTVPEHALIGWAAYETKYRAS